MRTQIVATIGPKCDSREAIQALIEEGMTIARMNFSHCTKEEFVARKALIEETAKALGRKVYILQDLQGPRIRVGELPDQGVELRDKDLVAFSTSPTSLPQIFINHPTLHQDLKVGDPLFLSSGEMELQVEAIQGSLIEARVVRGGVLYSRKGVNVPQTKLSTSGMTEKDKEDVAFALREGVDFIAISFVQSHEDVLRLRELTGEKVKIVSKIETALALKDIDRIIQASDAIMVARGDLGVEMPIESIPFIQKNLIRHATWHGKGSITATQMLTSMINHPRPTRAEVSDIANAVWDGTDAVMLSDETASGNYPKEAVAAMARIVKQAEEFHLLKPNNLIGLE